MVQHASIQVDFKGIGSNLSSRVTVGVCNFFEKEVSTPIFVLLRVMFLSQKLSMWASWLHWPMPPVGS
jgi:hypothetical protein